MTRKRSNHVQRKITSRKPQAKVDPHVEEQFLAGRLLGTEAAGTLVHNVTCMGSWPRVSLLSLSSTACVSSRPGQSGRCDGYILEGRELEFYQKKLKSKKGK